MYLGDGLLFELQNGKPKLIMVNHAVERNLFKNSFTPHQTYILNSRQPPCAENVRPPHPVGRRPAVQHSKAPRGAKAQAAGSETSFKSSGAADKMRASQMASKTREHRAAATKVETAPKEVTSEFRKSCSTSAKGIAAQSERWAETSNIKLKLKDSLNEKGPKDVAARLSGEQVRHSLSDVQPSSYDQSTAEEHRVSSQHVEDEVGGRKMDDDRVGWGETTSGKSPPNENRSHGVLFGWLEQCDTNNRASVETKKAQWRQQLNEQVGLKQQQQQRCSTSLGLQAEEAGSASSVQLEGGHREQPAAIRSSLRLGAVTPMEEALVWERREEQRRLWLEGLDKQRDEISQRRKREKMLLNQRENHELWAAHFDSLQRKPPAVTLAPPAAPPTAPTLAPTLAPSGDREASSSLSLMWDTSSSCGGAESAGRASVDAGSSDYPTKSSYLRSMTALLDPVQMEERERRRLKQLEQQRDIQTQVEERRRQKQEEEARRKKEEEEEERRITLERDLLYRRHQQEDLKHQEKREEKKQPKMQDNDGDARKVKEPTDMRMLHAAASVEDKRDTAVQTEVALPPVRAECPPPRSRQDRAGKENAGVSGGGKGGGAYETRRPEWNTHRPSRRFVPASERYPATLQRSRRESRLKRQEEILNLQHRNCLPASRPPSHKVDADRTSVSAIRGRSPPITQPSLQFIPYVRTDDVIHLDSTETSAAPPPHTHTAPSWAPPPDASSCSSSPGDLLVLRGKQRQQEILRGLTQLRQGLLQKQKELESEVRRHGNELLSPSKC
ncbi:coiled-coil domain-containing protein 66 isoform X7 [Syngnathus acus]|uniref:coiled-coil domain-containing protein 66 isoform X7 n=1 Tax=Syngnathus acus TaxID=161584 RepID=UPI0018862F62|nr:coiled-coil domain-containing protein 66 isoform X7 [Syngnathus acus]